MTAAMKVIKNRDELAVHVHDAKAEEEARKREEEAAAQRAQEEAEAAERARRKAAQEAAAEAEAAEAAAEQYLREQLAAPPRTFGSAAVAASVLGMGLVAGLILIAARHRRASALPLV